MIKSALPEVFFLLLVTTYLYRSAIYLYIECDMTSLRLSLHCQIFCDHSGNLTLQNYNF